MADFSPVMTWISGVGGSCEYVNRLWLEFSGRILEQELGDGWLHNVHPDDVARCVDTFHQAHNSRDGFTTEYRLRRRDGEFCWVAGAGAPRLDPDGAFSGFAASYINVSELKRTEDRLRHASKLESLGVLAGGIAHDFNNILTGIMGNASLLMDEVPPGSPAAELVENVVQSSERAAQLTRQMLAYSGKGRFVIQSLDLSKQLREMKPLLEVSIPKHISLRFNLGESLPRVEADPGQIQQAVLNLLTNSAEAISGAGGLIVISVEQQDLCDSEALALDDQLTPGNYVLLSVRDTGHGMDEATKARIFDPFFTTRFTGRGLGLAAVSGIVRGHKGAIHVDSRPGAGTTFTLYLPAASSPEPIAKSPHCSVDFRGSCVLVIDDQELVRRTLRITLQSFGFSVLLAEDGQKGLDAFTSAPGPVDLVILDMTMPVMSGEETLKRLRQIDPAVRVIATSGHNETQALRSFGAGLAGFIQKPYTAQQLANVLQSVLTPKEA